MNLHVLFNICRISVKYAKSTSKITADALVQRKKRLLEAYIQFEKTSDLYLTPAPSALEDPILGEELPQIPLSPKKASVSIQVDDTEQEYLKLEQVALDEELKEGGDDLSAENEGEQEQEQQEQQEEEEEAEEADEEEELDPVNNPHSLPSNLDQEELKRRGLGYLLEYELELRRSLLNESLDSLRVVLGQRTALFVNVVRNVKGTKTTTRAWAEVNECSRERNKIARVYCRSRQAAISLGMTSQELRTEYRPLTPQDLQVSADLTEHQRYNAKNERLSWIWQMNKDDTLADDSPELMECKFHTQYSAVWDLNNCSLSFSPENQMAKD